MEPCGVSAQSPDPLCSRQVPRTRVVDFLSRERVTVGSWGPRADSGIRGNRRCESRGRRQHRADAVRRPAAGRGLVHPASRQWTGTRGALTDAENRLEGRRDARRRLRRPPGSPPDGALEAVARCPGAVPLEPEPFASGVRARCRLRDRPQPAAFSGPGCRGRYQRTVCPRRPGARSGGVHARRAQRIARVQPARTIRHDSLRPRRRTHDRAAGGDAAAGYEALLRQAVNSSHHPAGSGLQE